MKRLQRLAAAALLLLLAAAPGFAQGTTGAVEGKIQDEQGGALPGVAVTVKNPATGFTRSAVSDAAGIYRFTALPIGAYEVRAELSGFATQSRKDTVVNVARTTGLDFRLTVASQTEEISVVADAPLIDTTDSGVGEVITSAQIENLPLNGRQFGNLAALVPGVSLGFHTDPTKSTQFAPQVAGGGGRNINYLIDGGDNNDDTVGGLVQNFPLDSIGEFNFETQRFRADSGRANGGALKVVTKSGTNELKGSVFEYFRDKSLNSLTEAEKRGGVDKGEYRKHQFGASLGGPIVKDKTHFFLSFERNQQDTTQPVDTGGLYPDKDGVFSIPFRENLFVGKITHQVNPDNYLSVRYGFNNNSQPYGASPQAPPENWGDSKNRFHSLNANLNSVLGAGKINEFVFQFSYFKNEILERSNDPTEQYPGGVFVGQSVNTPQQTFQKKYQFRDDLTWNKGSHELKAGVSFIYEPTLDITFSTGQQPLYVHLADARTSPISSITFNGGIEAGGLSGATIPNKQYALYLQDGWKVNEKLNLDLGVRYDLVTGFAFDQSNNIIFSELQDAGRAGRLAGLPGFEDFGKEPQEDKNNIAPRAGFTYDVNADGRFVVRGGVGRYYDFAYTNANILFAVIGAQSSFGQIYSNTDSSGIKNADGSFYQVGQALPPNQLVNAAAPRPSHAASPLIKQPYTDQANFGFAKAIGQGYAIEVDGVYAHGKDLGTRPRLNTRTAGGTSPRRLQNILATTGNSDFRVDISRGVSHYKGVNIALKKRWDSKLQMLVSYTLSKATSSTSLRATDEFGEYDVLDATDPFADRQEGPTRTDTRHRITASGVWVPGWGLTLAPVLRYKSAQPFNVITGVDNNLDGRNWDLPAGVATLNSGRGADFFQLDMRVSKRFKLSGRLGAELIAEGFNLTNDTNPGVYVANQTSATFGQPTKFAGDFQRGEQRLFQLGARLEF
jgi:Carboxypeptidase regulatory-like domain/TonB dependent receptor-like, beta-barrel